MHGQADKADEANRILYLLITVSGTTEFLEGDKMPNFPNNINNKLLVSQILMFNKLANENNSVSLEQKSRAHPGCFKIQSLIHRKCILHAQPTHSLQELSFPCSQSWYRNIFLMELHLVDSPSPKLGS